MGSASTYRIKPDSLIWAGRGEPEVELGELWKSELLELTSHVKRRSKPCSQANRPYSLRPPLSLFSPAFGPVSPCCRAADKFGKLHPE